MQLRFFGLKCGPTYFYQVQPGWECLLLKLNFDRLLCQRYPTRIVTSFPHKSSSKFALLYMAAEANLKRTYLFSSLCRRWYFLYGTEVSLYFFKDINTVGSLPFQVQALQLLFSKDLRGWYQRRSDTNLFVIFH